MNLTEMQVLLNFYVDDVVALPVATILLNAGQNKMATEVKCNFPQLSANNAVVTFVFDEKYHEMPIIYAAAMYKGYDSSVREKESYLNQFNNELQNFSENYTPPARYKDDFNVQQFTATANQYDYTITKETYNPRYNTIKIYRNDVEITPYNVGDSSTFSLDPTLTIVVGDAITAIWDANSDFNQPPYAWWEGMP